MYLLASDGMYSLAFFFLNKGQDKKKKILKIQFFHLFANKPKQLRV